MRIITMNPKSPFLDERDKEEKQKIGSTRHSIEQLVAWANKLNAKNYDGKIVVKGYSCMTLDFYWRVDDVVYIGPYWYGYKSQQTITYKFADGGKGFELYISYFKKLWDDGELMETLTDVEGFSVKKITKEKKLTNRR